jgi:Asp-tRNA(Asn)/Glu-tRNA(Gln) amidotransferase A subunit family amidase
MTTELCFLTVSEVSALLRAGTISPVDLTRACFDRIRKLDGELNAFILPLEEPAMADAKRTEEEIAGGDWKGPLHGIPIGLKDIYNTAGVATTGHSALFKDHVPAEDAFTVALLRQAGAVILGKLSTWEFAIGGASFDLPWPPARNPWNTAHEPGGSSSGAGAAVASGLALAAMGTDTGGSIRGPASWCGIAGLKPTYGYLGRRGILPLSFSLDHAGPMCWTSEDCALMMNVLARHDPLDMGCANVIAPDFAAGRDVGSYMLYMIIADETDAAAMRKWELYNAGADKDALAHLLGKVAEDTAPSETSMAAAIQRSPSPINFNMGTLVGSCAAVASMLDEVATMPGVKRIMLTFDDFLIGTDAYGQRIQPLMRCRTGRRVAA